MASLRAVSEMGVQNAMKEAPGSQALCLKMQSVVVLIAALGVGGLAAAADDALEILPPLFALALFLFAALSPVERSIQVVIGSIAVGCLGRIPLGEVGFKAIAIRGEEAAVMGLMLSAGLRLFKSPELRHANRLRSGWLGFSAIAAISLLASARLWTFGELAPGALYLVRWFGFGAVLYAASLVTQQEAVRSSIIRSIIATATALSVLGFLQLFFWPNMENIESFFPIVRQMLTDPHKNRLVSTMLDPNLLGAILAAASSLLMARILVGPKQERLGSGLLLGLLLLAIFLTVSRGSLLSTVFGMGVVVAVAAPRVLPLAGLAALGPLALAPRLFSRFQEAIWAPDGIPLKILGLSLRPEPSAYARWQSWAYAAEVVEKHPFLGIGYNNYGLAQLAIGDSSAALFGTDSTVLLVLATCGPLGVLLYLRLLWGMLFDAFKTQKLSSNPKSRANGLGVIGAMSSLLLAAIFTNALIYPPVLILLWAMGGVVAGEADELPAPKKKRGFRRGFRLKLPSLATQVSEPQMASAMSRSQFPS